MAQCCLIKCTFFSYEREKTVTKYEFEFNGEYMYRRKLAFKSLYAKGKYLVKRKDIEDQLYFIYVITVKF